MHSGTLQSQTQPLCYLFLTLLFLCPSTETARVESEVIASTALIGAVTDLKDGMSGGTTVIVTDCRSPSAASVGRTKSGAGRESSVGRPILSAE